MKSNLTTENQKEVETKQTLELYRNRILKTYLLLKQVEARLDTH